MNTFRIAKAQIRRRVGSTVSVVRSAGKPKIFCIGRNKTGTTSLANALRELGFIVAPQKPAELLIHDWARRDFRRIIQFCYRAQAFQDIPFSLPYTFQALDMQFPGSKFILTVRDSAEQWYESMTRFHAKLFGGGKIPTWDDLKRARYRYEGWAYEAHLLIYGTRDTDPYARTRLIDYYNWHNRCVAEYFHHRRNDLLVLNVAEQGAYQKLCEFVGRRSLRESFPWKNKTADIVVRKA